MSLKKRKIETTALALPSKQVGLALLKHADEMRQKDFADRIGGHIINLRVFRDRALRLKAESEFQVEWYQRKLDAIEAGKFTLDPQMNLIFSDPSLNFNTPDESKMMRGPMHREIPVEG